MIDTLITPQRVVELAYSNANYTPSSMIAETDIVTAERKYLIPVIGERLFAALRNGAYLDLMEDYVAPALALYVREQANLPSAPRSAEGMSRARSFIRRLSDHLDDNCATYAEYVASDNILKRCRINGTHIQIR
ncbi:MAG: hypothetical protein R3Y68_00055 [Rikenellaceae bacterium]